MSDLSLITHHSFEKEMKTMKYYNLLLWIAFILAALSLIIGVIFEIANVAPFGVAPISCIRFTAVCLLGAIALSLVEISLKVSKPKD
jgi:hypothetical protein